MIGYKYNLYLPLLSLGRTKERVYITFPSKIDDFSYLFMGSLVTRYRQTGQVPVALVAVTKSNDRSPLAHYPFERFR